MASARFLVQSSRVSGRQLHRIQTTSRNAVLSEAESSATVASASLHTFSKIRRSRAYSLLPALATDMSTLAALEKFKAGDGASPKDGWSSWEVIMSTVLAVAVTGSFCYMSAITPAMHSFDPSFSPKILPRGSGSSGGGRPGGSSAPPSSRNEQDENALVSDMVSEDVDIPYQVSVQAVRGGRLTMEDEYCVANGGRFAAVFDGHGGGEVSALLRARLFKLLSNKLKDSHDFDESRKFPSLSSCVAALRSAFEQIDHEVLLDDKLQYQGSTAVAVLVHEGDDGHRTLLSANVGDSRAILSRQGRAVDLTRDHKPNDEREKARIMAMGETIEWDHYCKVHRVRNLSLSRAIGDRFAKPVVSGEVEIQHFPEAGDSDEFFLLASDGLWDVMTSQEVVSFVHKRLSLNPKSSVLSDADCEKMYLTRRQTMSHAVAKEALRRGSADNVCVVIVWLNDPLSS